MVHIHVTKPAELTLQELSLCGAILSAIRANPIISEEGIPIANSQLSVHLRRKSDNKDMGTRHISRQEFVTAIHKALNASIKFTIDTDEGEQSKTIPLLPVALIDIPVLQDAYVVPVGDIDIQLDVSCEGQYDIDVHGALRDFVMQDIDEQRKLMDSENE